MTNEELQQKVKRLEEELTEVRIALLESKADKQPYKVEVPEDIGDYYNPDEFGVVDRLEEFSTAYGEDCYIRGLAFKTREEAEQFDKERILLFKMYKWAEEHNEGWTPNWQKGRPKYFAMFNRLTGDFSVGADCYCGVFTKLPYFKSDELVEQFIKEFGDEIIEVLC